MPVGLGDAARFKGVVSSLVFNLGVSAARYSCVTPCQERLAALSTSRMGRAGGNERGGGLAGGRGWAGDDRMVFLRCRPWDGRLARRVVMSERSTIDPAIALPILDPGQRRVEV